MREITKDQYESCWEHSYSDCNKCLFINCQYHPSRLQKSKRRANANVFLRRNWDEELETIILYDGNGRCVDEINNHHLDAIDVLRLLEEYGVIDLKVEDV